MQVVPDYVDVVEDVVKFLEGRINACLAAGIASADLIVDPGFGFGKTLAHNLTLLGNLDRIAMLGFPVLVGLSRKSMIGQILDRPVFIGGYTVIRQSGAGYFGPAKGSVYGEGSRCCADRRCFESIGGGAGMRRVRPTAMEHESWEIQR